ncbi:RNase P/RNase MRP subunit p29 [Bacteroidales bacterium 6E]|nr:RNase P/RNase MRP subunit p29 [Bacteroidales bacterium 6E]
MRKLPYIIFLAMLSLSTTSCLFLGPSINGNGDVAEEVRPVEDFNEVYVTSGMNVYFEQGTGLQVKVVADKNLMEVIETRVIGGRLEIRALANIWSASSKKVVITTDHIRDIEGTAGSNVYTNGRLIVDNLNIRASAGSNFRMDIEGKSVEASASSGANIYLSGLTRDFVARTSSGSNLKAEDLKTEVSDIKVSSGSNVWITSLKELSAHASSGGNVFYFGNPLTTSVSTSSGGSIQKRN